MIQSSYLQIIQAVSKEQAFLHVLQMQKSLKQSQETDGMQLRHKKLNYIAWGLLSKTLKSDSLAARLSWVKVWLWEKFVFRLQSKGKFALLTTFWSDRFSIALAKSVTLELCIWQFWIALPLLQLQRCCQQALEKKEKNRPWFYEWHQNEDWSKFLENATNWQLQIENVQTSKCYERIVLN